jgi:hypothetical protein
MLKVLKDKTFLPHVLINLIMEYHHVFLYMAFHKRVRNDYHCPDCRTFFISFHPTVEEAVEALDLKEGAQSDDEDENAIHKDMLIRGESVWIDEWVRRRNGDLYQVLSLNSETYNLYELPDEDTEIPDVFFPMYFVLHVDLDSRQWCPDNICFSLTCYETFEQARSSIPLKEKHRIRDHFWHYASKLHYEKGKFYKVIKMELGEMYNLNEHCEYVAGNTWEPLFRDTPFS